MEPLSVFRTIWRQRWLAFPAIVLTLVAAALVFVYGPREYESTISYALVDPQVPTDEQLQENPALKLLNSNNPYLRSSDPNLIANVLITRLNAESTQDTLKRERLSGTYEAAPGEGGQGLIVTITASGDSARQSLATTRELGRIFQVDLRQVQKVNDADDRYLFTSIVVDEPDRATEKLSSRLRTVIIVVVAGIILVFGAVSLGNAIDRSRRRRAAEAAAVEEEATEAAQTEDATVEPFPAQAEAASVPTSESAAGAAPVVAAVPASPETSVGGPAATPAESTAPADPAAPADDRPPPTAAVGARQDPELPEETTERSALRPASAPRPVGSGDRTASPRKPRKRTRVSTSPTPRARDDAGE